MPRGKKLHVKVIPFDHLGGKEYQDQVLERLRKG
jgi:hypothetical protein